MRLGVIILILAVLQGPQRGWAGEQVIDLGQLEVRGDVRRPSVNYFFLDRLNDERLGEIAESSFDEFEEKLLRKEWSEVRQ